MKQSFYSEVSDKIDTLRSTGRQHGTQQSFQTSLQYGAPKNNSIVADNRQTSLFKDYYKVIGSRYKFQLEDLFKKQPNPNTDNKFKDF